MVYRNLPVWPFPIDWSDSVVQRWEYDLRAVQIGFGAEVLEPLQQYAAHGFTFPVHLQSACEINRLERFLTVSRGRLRGWWLPGPAMELAIVAQHSAALIDVTATGLAAVWQEQPSVHIWLEDGTGAQGAAAAITAVSDNGDGTERLTLSAALTTAVDNTWMLRRLYLARLTQDEVTLRYLSPGRAQLQMDCYELPLEYQAVELGDQPIHLYQFSHTTAGVTQTWYYTSHDAAVFHRSAVWATAPMSHGRLSWTLDGTEDDVEVTSWRFEGNPLNAYFPFAPLKIFQVEIRELMMGASESKVLFRGDVKTVKTEGRKLTATCATRLDASKRQLPRFRLQRTCGYALYDSNCRVNRAAWVAHGAVAAQAGAVVTVSGAFSGRAAGFYTYGYVVATATDGSKEQRQILYSAAGSSTVLLTLAAPFQAVANGAVIDVYPGCDLTTTTCQNKFANYANFGGLPFVDTNLSLKAIKQKQSTGGKKG